MQPTNPHNGYLRLVENPWTWTAGNAVEETFEPTAQTRGYDTYCTTLLPSSFAPQYCSHTEIAGTMDGGMEYVVNNHAPVDYFNGGGTTTNPDGRDGIYYQIPDSIIKVSSSQDGLHNYFNHGYITPYRGINVYENCLPGDYTDTCSHSTGFINWVQFKKSALGPIGMYSNLSTGYTEFDLPSSAWSYKTALASGTTVAGYAPVISASTTSPTAGLTGTGNAAACFNAAGQLYRSTGSTCP